jgi:hypothetical protein
MKIEIVILFAIVAIASAARERVLYEAFSGLDCQAEDLGSIVVRFEVSYFNQYQTSVATVAKLLEDIARLYLTDFLNPKKIRIIIFSLG